MKKNFIRTILGSLALMLGFTSCKKDCTECFRATYTYAGGGTYTYSLCEDVSGYTEAEWDAYMAELEAYAAMYAEYTFERYEDCE